MHGRRLRSTAWVVVFDNDNDALIPEVWAAESLMILEANMVAANLVHRDFENKIAAYGDVVNAHRPGSFVAKRKTDADDVTVQDANTENVPVPLNQHLHTSFMIKDGEESKSFKDLVNLHLRPALISIAQFMDQMVLVQGYRFLANVVGNLGTDMTKSTVIAAREKLNTLKAPLAGRNFLVSPNVEGDLLNIGDFTNANTVGDDGSALREGNLGRKFGFDFFMDQNVPSVPVGSTVVAGAVNLGAGYGVGTTTMAVDGFGAALIDGSWFTVAGDMIPQMLTASAGGPPPTSMTFSPGLATAVVNDAVITVYTPGAVDQAVAPPGYAANYGKTLVVDGFAVAPKTGQLVSFAETTPRYGALGTDLSTIALDLGHPLDAAVANNDVVGLGPAGEYCFAFTREALALVTRPLAAPRAGAGALAAVASYNDLSIRVVITYDGNKQGHLVTVDLLCGVALLDINLGCLAVA